MEPQTLIYIIAGIGYFIYSIWKANQERNKQQAKSPQQQKPLTPPSTFGDILREIKKQQELAEAKKQPTVSAPVVKEHTHIKPKRESIQEEMNRAALAEERAVQGATAEVQRIEESRKERELYHIKTEEEQAAADEFTKYQFDARQAFIGSVIFERKYA